MSDDTHLAHTYPDLNADLPDPLTRRVVDDLERAYTRTPPPSLQRDVTAAVVGRAAELERIWPVGARNAVRGHVTPGRRIGRRLALALCTVVLLLLAAGAEMLVVPHSAVRQPGSDTGDTRPTADPTPIGTPSPIRPVGDGNIMVGTSLKMKKSAATIPPDVSSLYCMATVPHLLKGTSPTFHFQKAPYKVDYVTIPLRLSEPVMYVVIGGLLPEGQWRCMVDSPGGTIGSAYFRVQ